MSFSDNLQYLRRKHDFTQEQLAEKLDVSRQAVSKWESNQSYPEMDKLLAMCQLFSCQLNTLVQGNAQEELQEDSTNYDSFYNRCSLAVASGVAIILVGIDGLLWLQALNLEALGTFFLMLCAAVAIFIFIIAGIKMDFYKKNHPHVIDFYTKEQRMAFQQRYTIAIASGIALILLGMAFMVFAEDFANIDGNMTTAAFLLCVVVAVPIIVYYGMQKQKFDIPSYNKAENHALSIKSEKACSVIMLLATAIFLFMGFVYNLWHPSWAVFPIAAVLCGIVRIILPEK